MSVNPKKINISLNPDQYSAIVSALRSADIWHMTLEESHLDEFEQKIMIQAYKKFGLDLKEG